MCICRLRVPSVDHVIDYSSDDNMSTLFSIQTVNAFDTRNAIADTLYIYIYIPWKIPLEDITVYHRRFVLVTRNRKNIDSSLLYFLHSLRGET